MLIVYLSFLLCLINLLLFTHASLKCNSNITSTVLLRHKHRCMHCLSLHSKWIISWSNLLKSLYLLILVLDSLVFNETIVFPVVSWDCSVTVGSSLDLSLGSRLSSSIQNTPVPFIWSLYPSLNAAASNAVLIDQKSTIVTICFDSRYILIGMALVLSFEK